MENHDWKENWEDPLLPQQALPLPLEANMSAHKTVNRPADVVAAAASVVAACACDNASEALTERVMQPLAEAYLLSVRHEAQQLPKVISAPLWDRETSPRSTTTTFAKDSAMFSRCVVPKSWIGRNDAGRESDATPPGQRKSGLEVNNNSLIDKDNIAEIKSFKHEYSHVSNDTVAASSVYQNSLVRPDFTPVNPADACSSCETSDSRVAREKLNCRRQHRGASYVVHLVALDKQRQAASASINAPAAAWKATAASKFKLLRARLQEKNTLVNKLAGFATNCPNWEVHEWQLYCRCYPPSLAVLAACDTVTLCRILNLLVDDIEHQEEIIMKKKRAAEDGATGNVSPSSVALPNAGAVQKGETSSAKASCECCQEEYCCITLQQACWLFGIFLFLDELQAMDADVAYRIQQLRRYCEIARSQITCADVQGDENRIPAVTGVTDLNKGVGGSVQEQLTACISRNLLAATNLLIVLINDVFQQK